MSRINYTKFHSGKRRVNRKLLTTVPKVQEFIGKENCTVISGSNASLEVLGFNKISDAVEKEMTFCSARDANGIKLISSSKASVIICHTSLISNVKIKDECTLIFVANPRLWFIRVLVRFAGIPTVPKGIHPTAVVESKKIAKSAYIGAYSYIAPDVIIGENTVIREGVYIYDKTTIGNNVVIDSGSVIGLDGFGYEKNEKGEWEKFPHLGGIEIHDNVEIGANSCIDRGTLENTVIGSGTKIDNLVHIAHNVKIGRNCMIVAQSLVAGSCVLEDGAYMAMCACTKQNVRLGRNSFVGMGAVVTKDVSDGETVIGVPARPFQK